MSNARPAVPRTGAGDITIRIDIVRSRWTLGPSAIEDRASPPNLEQRRRSTMELLFHDRHCLSIVYLRVKNAIDPAPLVPRRTAFFGRRARRLHRPSQGETRPETPRWNGRPRQSGPVREEGERLLRLRYRSGRPQAAAGGFSSRTSSASFSTFRLANDVKLQEPGSAARSKSPRFNRPGKALQWAAIRVSVELNRGVGNVERGDEPLPVVSPL